MHSGTAFQELMTGQRFGVVVLLLCVLSVAGIPTSSDAIEGRVLGDYRFIPSSAVQDPFIATHFRNAMGIASASNVEIPLLVFEGPPPDTLLSLNGDLLFIRANVEYQHRVHSRVAVHASGNGSSRVGTSGPAMVCWR